MERGDFVGDLLGKGFTGVRLAGDPARGAGALPVLLEAAAPSPSGASGLEVLETETILLVPPDAETLLFIGNCRGRRPDGVPLVDPALGRVKAAAFFPADGGGPDSSLRCFASIDAVGAYSVLDCETLIGRVGWGFTKGAPPVVAGVFVPLAEAVAVEVTTRRVLEVVLAPVC